ncbi:chromosome replication/partitioning protein [Borrelia persica]|uniref:chromosome replication/partitioning protein n=1 Tax=Borrelia persica TaxID=44448 RepID=UPI0004672AA2|nr:chromosome replication/partitioning protein [Borrelia persica]
MSSKIRNMAIKIKDRIMDNEEKVTIIKDCESEESKKERYEYLVSELALHTGKEIIHKIANMKILREIKEHQYYKYGNFNNFEEFTRTYRIAKSQAYEYVRMANALKEGLIEEIYIIENGIQNTLLFLRNKEGITLKRSNRNIIKPLRFQLRTEQAYIYYKAKAKFTSFLLEKLLKDEKSILDKYEAEYRMSKK